MHEIISWLELKGSKIITGLAIAFLVLGIWGIFECMPSITVKNHACRKSTAFMQLALGVAFAIIAKLRARKEKQHEKPLPEQQASRH